MGFKFNVFTGTLDLVGTSSVVVNEYQATIANNQATPADVTGMNFNVANFRSLIVTYQVYRTTNTLERVETGTITVNYKTVANTCDIDFNNIGESGLIFTVTAAGQVQYTSDNMSGTGYVGKIRFKMQTLSVES